MEILRLRPRSSRSTLYRHSNPFTILLEDVIEAQAIHSFERSNFHDLRADNRVIQVVNRIVYVPAMLAACTTRTSRRDKPLVFIGMPTVFRLPRLRNKLKDRLYQLHGVVISFFDIR